MAGQVFEGFRQRFRSLNQHLDSRRVCWGRCKPAPQHAGLEANPNAHADTARGDFCFRRIEEGAGRTGVHKQARNTVCRVIEGIRGFAPAAPLNAVGVLFKFWKLEKTNWPFTVGKKPSGMLFLIICTPIFSA